MIGDLTYEYDKAGNRTKTGGSWARTGMPEPITTTSYDANNRQLTFGDKTLTYDDNGNLQSITDSSGTTLYQWNARNQLVGINGPNVNATFVYDGIGRRQKKTIGGSLTEFLYDGINPVQESSGASILANILPGLGIDQFFARTDIGAGATSNFLADALGSPVAVTDGAGTVQTSYTYEAFGQTTATGTLNSSSYQYTGRENDGTGIYYYRARYYAPALQRFISEDPIGFKGGINVFAYVNNNPIGHTDPLGLKTCDNDKCPDGRKKSFYDCFTNCLRDYDPFNLILNNLAASLGGYLLTLTQIGGGYTVGTSMFRLFLSPLDAALAGAAARSVLGASSGVLSAIYAAIAARCLYECSQDPCSH